jgi:hypothetical protein
MQYIITEEQHQLILTEGFKDAVENRLKNAYNFTKDIIAKTKEQFGNSFRFALTYGAGIGALAPAIDEYLRGSFSGLDDSQIASLIMSAISIVFFNTKDYLDIYKKMKKDGLIDELGSAVSFTEKLKSRVSKILDVLGVATYQALDVVSFSFLLPILPAIIKMLSDTDLDMVALKGLLNSSFITVSAITLQKIIGKLSEKISPKNSSDDVSEPEGEFQSPESDIV